MLGLIAGALPFVSGVDVLLGVLQQDGAARTIATMPEFFWELLLGIYLPVKGFRSAAVASQPVKEREERTASRLASIRETESTRQTSAHGHREEVIILAVDHSVETGASSF